MNYFLGIDAGTTSLKAALYDTDGCQLGMARQEYTLETPAPGKVELAPAVYWQACCEAIQSVLRQSGVAPEDITALSISSQGETLVPLDAAGRPTRKAIVWLDNRAVEEARDIKERFGVETVYHTTGQPDVTPTWPACKILWIRRHEPEIYAATACYLLLEDYLLYRLTGGRFTEISLQASSLLADIVHRRWWAAMLDYLGLGPEHLGNLVEPGQVVGRVCPRGAEATGLSQRTLVVSGGMDQVVGAAGAGNVRPGTVTEMTGGALAIVATLDRPLFDPRRRVPCHYHVRPETYCLLPWAQTAGMALKWFRDQFCQEEARAAAQAGIDTYDYMAGLAEAVSAGSDGLVVLPHLEGAACPEFDPAARAVFYGATLRHTRAHFTRAIMEAVAYMLRKNLELIEQLGVPVHEIRSIGGGARSPAWLHMKADVLQKPVVALASEEVACLGAALLAATATGFHNNLEEGIARMVRIKETIEPRRQNAMVYAERYAEYNELYARLAPLFGRAHS